MTEFITVDDLAPFATIDEAKAAQMIADAIALAMLAAPCLADELTEEQEAAAKAVLRGAVLRWNEAGNGALASQTMGPLGVTLDTRQQRRAMFWPSEIVDLQRICHGADDGSAFSVDTATATPMVVHPTFDGWHGGWSGSPGGWAWNDNGTFIPNNF